MATTQLTYKQISHAAAIDATQAFTQDFQGLREMLSNAVFSVLPEGTALLVSTSTAAIESGDVDPGEVIPASQITDATVLRALKYKKYRTLVPFEKVGQQGSSSVVNATRMLSGQLQKDLKKTVADALALEGSTDASGTNLQTACANAWAKLTEVREGFATTPVFFCSSMTAAGYLGTATVSTQTAFGLEYLVGFLGLGTLIVNPSIPDAIVYATAAENINISAADVASVGGAGYVTDESGVIAVSAEPRNDCTSIEIVELAGIDVLPAVISHVVKATISVDGE